MTPLVSIIIPVGPKHRAVLGVALASALHGTVQDVEAIVVNDTDAALGTYADTRVRVIDAPKRPGLRPSIARNAGLAIARAPLTLHLDADDYLLPDGLALLLRGLADAPPNRSYVYGLHYGTRGDDLPVMSGTRPVINSYGVRYDDWDYTAANLHAISALAPTEAQREVGGFDEGAAGWDDWTLWARMRVAGYCGHEIKQPVFVYRVHLSEQHHRDNDLAEAGMQAVRSRIIGKGWRPMGCGCGGAAKGGRVAAGAAVLGGGIPAIRYGDESMILLEYIGPGEGASTIRGPVTKTSYRVGRSAANRYLSTGHTLRDEDVDGLLAMPHLFKRIDPPPAFAKAPEPVEPTEAKASVITGEDTLGDDDALTEDDGIARPTAKRRSRAKDGSDQEAA